MSTNVTIHRRESGDQGTFGVLSALGFSCYTGELPWRDNRPNESCVPVGEYRVIWAMSPHFRRFTYRLIDVSGRGGVLIHSANLMGDIKLGFRAQLLGCIALGERLGWMDSQKAVLVSAPAVRNFATMMQYKPFILEVLDA